MRVLYNVTYNLQYIILAKEYTKFCGTKSIVMKPDTNIVWYVKYEEIKFNQNRAAKWVDPNQKARNESSESCSGSAHLSYTI